MSEARYRCWVAAAAVLWLAGCLTSPAPRLYVLSPQPAPGASAGDPATTIDVGIGPITLAPHLDRPQIVSRRGSQVDLGELDRWAEPLAGGIARALAENLEDRLGGARTWLYPWQPSAPVEVQVAVDVRRFDDAGDGNVRLAARWTLFGAGEVLATGRFDRRQPAASPAPEAIVEALSQALAELSAEIAAQIAEHATS